MGRRTGGIILKAIERRTPPFKVPEFGCLRGVPSINVTKGCIHNCLYCYARTFPGTPPSGEVHLFKNLPEMIYRSLWRMKRLPTWVSFSTASDPFQAIDEVLEVTYRTMALLLESGIGISFLTKGVPPVDFIDLFRRYPQKVRAKIGLVSLREDYWRIFEPDTPPPEERLSFARMLRNSGIDTSIRIDPVVPSVSDKIGDIKALFLAIKETGIKEVAISCLVMRPYIEEFFKETLPTNLSRSILAYYRGQPYQRVITSAQTRLLPLPYRRRLYGQALSIGRKAGITIKMCGCKNPDLPWQNCDPWLRPDEPAFKARQESLFT